MIAPARAIIEDLYRVEGNAELVNGEIIRMAPAGDDPNSSGGETLKIVDYFLAATLVAWAVNLQSGDVVKKYTAQSPYTAEVFRRGDTANAEPAVPGWTFAVNNLFL